MASAPGQSNLDNNVQDADASDAFTSYVFNHKNNVDLKN